MSTSSAPQPGTADPTGRRDSSGSLAGRARLSAVLMPRRITPWVRAMTVASVLTNILLIVTGGAVRLTSSGLGCPTWPRCTADSWSNVPAMGLHGYIEFGNRLLTFVLAVVAVLTWLAVSRIRRAHRDLFWLATGLVLGIPVQAVVGGISVHLDLNPWMVGVHYILSAIMIALAAVLVSRVRRYSLAAVREAEALDDVRGPDPLLACLGVLIGFLAAVAVYMGTVVTGTGPHSGDPSSVRHGFNATLVARMHAAPVWLMLFSVVAVLVLARRRHWAPAVRRSCWWILAVMVYQGTVGYVQFFNGLPGWLVEFHMLGSALVVWTTTVLVERTLVLGAPARRERALLHVQAPVDPQLAAAGRSLRTD